MTQLHKKLFRLSGNTSIIIRVFASNVVFSIAVVVVTGLLYLFFYFFKPLRNIVSDKPHFAFQKTTTRNQKSNRERCLLRQKVIIGTQKG